MQGETASEKLSHLCKRIWIEFVLQDIQSGHVLIIGEWDGTVPLWRLFADYQTTSQRIGHYDGRAGKNYLLVSGFEGDVQEFLGLPDEKLLMGKFPAIDTSGPVPKEIGQSVLEFPGFIPSSVYRKQLEDLATEHGISFYRTTSDVN